MEIKNMIALDYCKFVTDGTHDSPKAKDNGFKLITSKHLKRYEIDFESANFISEEDYKKVIERSFVAQWDILFSMIGTIGNLYIETNSEINYACKNMGIFQLGGDEMKSKWLYYYLQSPKALEYIGAVSRGTTQGYVPLGALRKMPVDVVEDTIRDKIVTFLWDLDEKIKTNIAINNNLSKQIKTICTAWLSDYAPFGGVLPDDWSKTSLSSIADFVSGYSYKGTELTESNVAMATIKNFDRKGGFKLDGYKEIVPSGKLKDTQHAELFDTLVAHTDLTQNAEVIGNAEPVMSKSGYSDIVFSMDLVKVVPKNKHISKFLIAAILQDKKFKAHCLGYVNGTTVLHLSKKALSEYQLYLPNELSALKPLDELVTALYQQISANIEEITKLEALRDAILPKLMSGELDVSDIDL